MPKTARVWIYQSDRSINTDEVHIISMHAENFLNEWAAHGVPLQSSFRIFHDKFLIISVDEQAAKASGCSIDASVALIRSLEQKIGINFFDRSKVAFLINEEVFLHDMTAIKELVSEGVITNQTPTFNNLVKDISELEQQWVIPAGESWIKRYF